MNKLEQMRALLDSPLTLVMLWHEGYYDGPLSGVAELNGDMVWFDLDVEDDARHRTYNVYWMDDEIKKEVIRRHQDFRNKVGWHSDYGDNHREFSLNSGNGPWCVPAWIYRIWRHFQFNRFYAKKKSELNLTEERNLIGIFDEDDFERRRENHV